jgi:hypothetical protein
MFSPIFAFALAGCNSPDPNKVEEKRIHAEIQELTEGASKHLRSEEMRAAMMRLNELRPEFPNKRENIERDAAAVKGFFVRAIEDDLKLTELWKRLLVLPLSSSYEKCVSTQIQIQDYAIMRSQNVIEQLDVLSDPSVTDRLTLDSRVETIQAKGKPNEAAQSELQAFVDQNCRE